MLSLYSQHIPTYAALKKKNLTQVRFASPFPYSNEKNCTNQITIIVTFTDILCTTRHHLSLTFCAAVAASWQNVKTLPSKKKRNK